MWIIHQRNDALHGSHHRATPHCCHLLPTRTNMPCQFQLDPFMTSLVCISHVIERGWVGPLPCLIIKSQGATDLVITLWDDLWLITSFILAVRGLGKSAAPAAELVCRSSSIFMELRPFMKSQAWPWPCLYQGNTRTTHPGLSFPLCTPLLPSRFLIG